MTDPAAVDSAPERPESRPSRRALLGGGAIAGVVGALAGARAVSAASAPEADVTAQAIAAELAARDLYRMSSDADWEVFAASHEAFAERLAGIVGRSANTTDDQLVGAFADRFEANDATAALELENALSAAHAGLLGQVENTTLLAAIASIVSSESRFAAVHADLGDAGLDAAIDNPAAQSAPEA